MAQDNLEQSLPNVSLPRWMDLHPGIVSLLAACSAAEPFAGGIRPVAALDGGLIVTLRTCSCGPESRLANIYDWAGGFRISLGGPGFSSAAIPPIPSEAAVVKALHAMGDALAVQGMPAPLTDFAPGGRMFNEGFNPLLPTLMRFDETTLRTVVETAMKASETETRVAPGALVPDAMNLGLPVYDLRMDSAVRDQVIAHTTRMDTTRVSPLLVKQTCMGGSQHYLLVDGIRDTEVSLTWARSPDASSFEHNIWPHNVAEVQEAPSFLHASTRPPRDRLN